MTTFKALRTGTLALGLVAGATLIPQAVSAGSVHEDGDFGGTWIYIAPSDHYHWRYAERSDPEPLVIAPPVPAYAYDPAYDPGLLAPPPYADDPGIAVTAPDVPVAVEVD